MKQTRKIIIQDRVFSLEDLKRIAKLFKKHDSIASKSNHQKILEYEVEFSDNTSFQADDPEILSESVLNRTGRPMEVRFRFHNLDLGHHLIFSVSHGDSSYGNYASVEGNDESWVRDNFLALEEAIHTAKSQSFWFRNHRAMLSFVVASAVALLLRVFLNAFFDVLSIWVHIEPLPAGPFLRSVRPLVVPVGEVVSFLFFLLPGYGVAFPIVEWFLKMWPQIELDIGSKHLKTEKLRRKRIGVLITLILIPILTNVLYEVMKSAWRSG